MKSILFWVAVGIVAWLGLRHLFSIMTGWSQDGQLKPGQRLCHTTSLALLMGSSVLAVILKVWWPLLTGVILEYLFRHFTIWTGNKYPLNDREKQMGLKEFVKHISSDRTNDKA
ncbi:MAG: hypothetical protein PHY02_09230 [Phycisphaerae bacterium]|nr:hypothetical protein [Phycisphaerae bacterium]